MAARARFGISSRRSGPESRHRAFQHARALGTNRCRHSIRHAHAADQHARQSAQLHHASTQDASDPLFRRLGNHRCGGRQLAQSFESVRTRDRNRRFVVQTARFGSHFAHMRFLVLSVLIATAIVVVAADSKKSTDFRGPKKPATNEVKSSTSTNDPVEAEYLKLLAMDDLAQKEVDVWMKDAQAFQEKGAPQDMAALKEKVQKRLKPVKDAYEKFLAEHPKHSEARLAYGSFLMDTEDEDEAVVQMERAREDDPQNPAGWKNLANHYGDRGPVKRAFQYYEKAIELNPDEPVYKQNFATTVYLFRKDAQEFYRIN